MGDGLISVNQKQKENTDDISTEKVPESFQDVNRKLFSGMKMGDNKEASMRYNANSLARNGSSKVESQTGGSKNTKSGMDKKAD